MTYRERRQKRADRLREWSEKRATVASHTLSSIADTYRGDYAFNTQPGHIPERARVINRENAAFASLDKADKMASRADGIESQLDHSIYDDDPDAQDKLNDRIAYLSKRLELEKLANKAYRKGGIEAVRACGIPEDMVKYAVRTMALCPHLKGPFFSTNTSANLRRQRQRLERLEHETVHGKPWKYYTASKYPGTCVTCQLPISVGETILYRDSEVKHFSCHTEDNTKNDDS